MATAALLPLRETARLLCVPVRWLRAEAEAGRLPHLRAGNAILFDPDLIEQLLIERARRVPGLVAQEGGAHA